ncbi:hypothetical protein FQR65_LT07725 [Abscondita terminalis]|nr:hypothetical protein FQR65_LT07725 [Abscondita terminalis]
MPFTRDQFNEINLCVTKAIVEQMQSATLIDTLATKKLDLDLSTECIDRIHRTGGKRTDGIQDRLLSKLRGTPYVVKEDLTRNKLNILMELQDKVGFPNTWTRNGLIFWKDKTNLHVIKTIQELQKVLQIIGDRAGDSNYNTEQC